MTDPLEGGDTEEMAYVLEDADVVEAVPEVTSDAITAARRICSECRQDVMGIPTSTPPTVDELLRISVFWSGCVFSGPIGIPSWWFCARGGDPGKEPGTADGIFGVTGSFRLTVRRAAR